MEKDAAGDAFTSDVPWSRSSCALRGLPWPGTPALLIRMVWLMKERWIWAGFGAGTGFRGMGSARAGGPLVLTGAAGYTSQIHVSPWGLNKCVWKIVWQKDLIGSCIVNLLMVFIPDLTAYRMMKRKKEEKAMETGCQSLEIKMSKRNASGTHVCGLHGLCEMFSCKSAVIVQ